MSMLEPKASSPSAGQFVGIRPVGPGLSRGSSTVKSQSFNRVLDKAGRFQSAPNKTPGRTDKSNLSGCETNLTLAGQDTGAVVKTLPSPESFSADKMIAAVEESNPEPNPDGFDCAVVPEDYQSVTLAAAYPATAQFTAVDEQLSAEPEINPLNRLGSESAAKTQALSDAGLLINPPSPDSFSDSERPNQTNPSFAFYALKSAAEPADSLARIEKTPDQAAPGSSGAAIGQKNELLKLDESSPVKDTETNLGSFNTKPAPNITTGSPAANQAKPEQTAAPPPLIFGEAEAATSESGQINKAVSPEDIRFRLMSKTQVNPGLNQVPVETDVKALLGEEIKRLRMEKPSPESGVNKAAEPLPAKTQPEIHPPEIGVNRPGINLPQPELELVTSRPPGAGVVDPQDLIEQIVKKVEMVNKAFNTEMKIQLKPEFLGRMVIKIAVEEGIVTARFITESHQVKHLLENNLGALRQNLESQGLRVDRTEVNVQLPNGGAFQGDDSGRQQMWQEYAERNSYNHLPNQAEDDYETARETLPESYGETDSTRRFSLSGEGRFDFTI
ncbi:Flagellar hook-length control protein-like, C-terminal [Syntrophomonas zehnderi OL-4]|uniref:Flagellar hook-length control protein-like, C-terminal n=1 Tax=Syntrophomonas zehnderi OL-4 TaxID=690567 RepID=A0A0E4GBD1_9FIRM|nr:flagellar hook-length control protein FliK [Syntrophomonas zehnderi]CFX65060.1 Flagellar hook-length control protein-like, C-terminal [Syntrophomonas zehnderi OL-4]